MDKVVTQKLRLALYKELLNCDSKEEKTIQAQLNSVPMLFKKNIEICKINTGKTTIFNKI